MPFIGNKPSAVPLTSADIADGIITSAKIVDATITNSDVASSIITGQTAETSIAGGDSVLIYDDSASALRKMTRTNFVSGLGGLTEADAWRVNTSLALSGSGQTDITANWERVDSDGFDKIGTGLSQSSGIFSFPSTGYYYINFFGTFSSANARTYLSFSLWVTLNNSTYSIAGEPYSSISAANAYAGTALSNIIKVTDTANIKFKFTANRENSLDMLGSSDVSHTGFSSMKLGEL
jgi:hypothetical protein